MKCRLCENELHLLWEFNNSPIVNNYSEKKYTAERCDSHIYFCQSCQSIFNSHQFEPDEIFKNYSYNSFYTRRFDPIFKILINLIKKKNIMSILEIGCNNGSFLSRLKKYVSKDIFFVGIDPSCTEDQSKNKEITFIKSFFDERLVKKERMKNKFDLIICRHMFAHTPYPKSIARCMGDCVSKKGFLYIENASMHKTIERSDFSQLYLEHYFALSPLSVKSLFYDLGFSVLRSEVLNIHNGSFGLVMQNIDENKSEIKTKAQAMTYNLSSIRERLLKWEDNCINFLRCLDKKNAYIWGVTAKTVMVLNVYNINTKKGKNIFVGAIDFTEIKVGKYVPGTNIKIFDENFLNDVTKPTVVIGARNFKDEIIKKIQNKCLDAEILVPPF